jgi:hypothetical protein
MCVIYVRKQLNDADNKIESMFDLLETLTLEVKRLKIHLAPPQMMMGSNISQNSHQYTGNNVDIIEYIESDQEENESDSDSDSDNNDDNNDDNNETKEVDYTVTSSNEVYHEESDDEESDDEESDDEESDDEKDIDEEHEDEQEAVEGENNVEIDNDPVVKKIDLTEINVESELNDVTDNGDYSKMTVKELKQVLINKGYTNDVTKLKRQGLIALLNNETL